MTTSTDDEILTIAQVAELLHIERHRVTKLARDGRLPYIELGPRSIRFLRSEVLRALADRGL